MRRSEIHLLIREKVLTMLGWILKISTKIADFKAIFGWNFEIWAVQKYVNLLDLVKSFPISIYLQKSASIQPRTSLSKFGGESYQLPP